MRYAKVGLATKALEKMTIATNKENQPLAGIWSKVTSQYQEAAKYYRKIAEANLSGENDNDAEIDRWEEIADSAKKSADALQKEAEELEKSESD